MDSTSGEPADPTNDGDQGVDFWNLLTLSLPHTLTKAGRRQVARETRDWDEATDILARFLEPDRS